MRIHHVTPHFYPEKGGVETNVLGLARYFVERGHEVILHTSQRTLAGSALPAEATVDGIRIRRYRPLVQLGYYATLLRPRIEEADVVHLHGYGFLTNDSVARKVPRSAPIVYSLHHGVAQPARTKVARVKRALYDPLFGRKTLRRADAIVPASEPDRRWLVAAGFPPNRIHVLPTGLDQDAFEPGSPEKARRRFQINRYVVFLGRLHRAKAPDHLLRAVAALGDEWTGSVVFIGPDGGERASLERIAGEPNLQGRVVFAGEVDEVTKRDLLAGAECLVLPSFYEAQGIAIAEAWAQARPVVAARVGGIPYSVEEGQNGLLYSYGDIPALTAALREIVMDRTYATRMGGAGLRKARSSLAWDRIASRVEEVYLSLTSTAGRDRA
jgi:glycosyltransferase involved in cell wall biosynthesis